MTRVKSLYQNNKPYSGYKHRTHRSMKNRRHKDTGMNKGKNTFKKTLIGKWKVQDMDNEILNIKSKCN